jgi:Ca2+-binding RTX toxin-like protein
MAIYVFEEMTQGDAAAFNGVNGTGETAVDSLIFLSASASNLVVTTNAATNLTSASYVLSSGDKTLTFSANELAGASNRDGGLVFRSGDVVHFAATTGTSFTAAQLASDDGDSVGHYGADGADRFDLAQSFGSDTVFGGAGGDTILGSGVVFGTGTGTNNSETQTDWLMGGAGSDTITGNGGNEHIYGFSNVGAGQRDGGDSLSGGAGNDYIQGNAGNDTIDGGADNDRLYGGADADTITGGTGYDYLQGNKGDDTLDGGNGDDTVRGGAGNDNIDDTGVATGTGVNTVYSNDELYGDLGNDTINGGAGVDTLFGGAGNDVFVFDAGENVSSHIGADAKSDPLAGLVDTIGDFNTNEDTIRLPFALEGAGTDDVSGLIINDNAESSATTALGAYNIAVGLLAGVGAGEESVAAVEVGSDTYLFYGTGGTGDISSAIKLIGVDSDDLTGGNFSTLTTTTPPTTTTDIG